MNKKRITYIGILFIITVIVTITSFSYAFLTRIDEQHGKLNMTVGNLDYKIESDDLNNNSITLSANESKEIEIIIRSLNKINSKYKLYTNSVENVSIGYLDEEGFDESTGIVNSNGTVKVKIVLDNESDTNKTITFGVQGGFDYNDVVLLSGRVEIEEGEGLCTIGLAYEFDYTGDVQEFTAKCEGTYKIETWGAQGGSYNNTYYGGYGSYSIGNVELIENQKLYVNVGGKGNLATCASGVEDSAQGGYNGGGNVRLNYSSDQIIRYGGSGGGATHIAKSSGLLATLSDKQTDILIVSGGGGGYGGFNRNGTMTSPSYGGMAGGFKGATGTEANSGTGGTQTAGGTSGYGTTRGVASFGQGGSSALTGQVLGGAGGGGFYGGGAVDYIGSVSGGGGSGYIGNNELAEKKMTCYNCATSTSPNTYTQSNTCTNETPTENCAKKGDGYARITYLGKYNYLIKSGVTIKDFTLNKYYNGNASTKITNKVGYIQYDSYPSYNVSNYVTTNPVNVTDYKYLKFRGTINDNNSVANTFFISKTNNINHYDCTSTSVTQVSYAPYVRCVSDGKAVLTNKTDNEYIIDISDLTGDYYIGFASSNREMYIYDLVLYN